jgi:hypothetical protein
MSLILNFFTEISIIDGNPQTLPQIRIEYDVEAESCLNVTAIVCPNNLRLIIKCRLGTCVRPTLFTTANGFANLGQNQFSVGCENVAAPSILVCTSFPRIIGRTT